MRRVQTQVDNGWMQDEEFYLETDYFCPKCGNKTVWKGEQDECFYVGYDYVCTTCVKTFYLPKFDEEETDARFIKITEEIVNKLK